MKKIIVERKDVAFYIKLFPLKMHPDAYEKSKAILCEKSLALLEQAYEKKPLPKATCETTIIDDNIKLAERLRINSLPTMILPDGRVISGYKDAEAIKALIGK